MFRPQLPEPGLKARQASHQLAEQFSALIADGFTRAEALDIITTMLHAGITKEN